MSANVTPNSSISTAQMSQVQQGSLIAETSHKRQKTSLSTARGSEYGEILDSHQAPDSRSRERQSVVSMDEESALVETA